jgi:predicted phosphodiesterase
MRLWIMSDLHIESCRWDLPDPRPDCDVLVAAGDIHSPATAAVEWLARRADGKPVIYVPGNHEWYALHGRFNVEEEQQRAAAAASRAGVHMLTERSVIIDGIRFLGSTLWTDYELRNEPERDMGIAARGMNDHRFIFPRAKGGPLRPQEARDWHRNGRAWLEGELAESRSESTVQARWRDTVVVTHHMPHPKSIALRYASDPLNSAFCSDLSELVERSGAALWIHGHTHTSSDYRAGQTRVVCNPKGYGPGSIGAPIENADFDPHFVVEV